jgi:hypothetical protein
MNPQLTHNYTLQGMNLAKSILRFPEDYTIHHKCKAYRFINMHINQPGALKKEELNAGIIETFDRLLKSGQYPDCLFELADLYMSFNSNSSNLLLDKLREENYEIIKENGNMIVRKVKPKEILHTSGKEIKLKQISVYNDSQNVHTNESTVMTGNIAEILFDRCKEQIYQIERNLEEKDRTYYHKLLEVIEQKMIFNFNGGNREFGERDHYATSKDYSPIIKSTFQYIRNSISVIPRNVSNGLTTIFHEHKLNFNVNKNEYVTLELLFISVFLWITEYPRYDIQIKSHPSYNNEVRKNAMFRLLEEMENMEGYCNSGHFARLINVLQGFTQDPALQIKISDYEQCKAVITNFLNKKLQNCEDDILEELDDSVKNRDKLKKYIIRILREKDFEKEYGKDFIYMIPRVVKEYLKIEI